MSPDVHLSIFVISETSTDTLLRLYMTPSFWMRPNISCRATVHLKTHSVKQNKTYCTFRNSRRSLRGITRFTINAFCSHTILKQGSVISQDSASCIRNHKQPLASSGVRALNLTAGPARHYSANGGTVDRKRCVSGGKEIEFTDMNLKKLSESDVFRADLCGQRLVGARL